MRPRQPSLQNVIGNVEVELTVAAPNSQCRVLHTDAAHYVYHRALGLEADAPIRVSDCHALQIDVACAVHFDHIASHAVSTVEYDPVLARPADHDRVTRSSGA